MSEETTGGIIGGRTAAHLGERHGKRRSNLWGGLLCLVMGFTALAGYAAMDPATPEDYQRVQIAFEEAYFRESRRSDDIILRRGNTEYAVNHALWKGRHEAGELLAHLRAAEEATLWVKPGSSQYRIVRGLQAGAVSLSPDIGTNLDNRNRDAILWLAFLSFGLGVWGVGCSVALSKKGA